MATLQRINKELVVRELGMSATNSLLLDYGEVMEVSVKFVDKSRISEKQRKFIFALCNDMSFHTGYTTDECRTILQIRYANLLDIEVQSLSSCSKTYATGLIKSIIDFFISEGIPFRKSVIKDNEYTFTQKQIYMMCIKRLCVVCGNTADIHHFNCRVGMGRNREKISHIGMEIIPLCREHHQEAHTIGDIQLSKKYHIEKGVIVDRNLELFIKNKKINLFKEDL